MKKFLALALLSVASLSAHAAKAHITEADGMSLDYEVQGNWLNITCTNNSNIVQACKVSNIILWVNGVEVGRWDGFTLNVNPNGGHASQDYSGTWPTAKPLYAIVSSDVRATLTVTPVNN
jgi:frataxin-like iron-binding protein CyaY